MKKGISILTLIVFMIALFPNMVKAEGEKEKLIIDFGKIHHTADRTGEQIYALELLMNKDLLVDKFNGDNLGMNQPYLASPADKPLINIDIKDDNTSYTAYPIHKAENVSEDDNIEYEFTDNDKNDQNLEEYSALFDKYSGILVKFGEDQDESEDIIITAEELCNDSLTTRQRYSIDFLYDIGKLKDNNGISSEDDKQLLNLTSDGYTLVEGLTEEDNVIYELTEEDYTNTYSRFDGKKRIILKLSDKPAPKENINNPETNQNGLIIGSILLLVTTSLIILNRKKIFHN